MRTLLCISTLTILCAICFPGCAPGTEESETGGIVTIRLNSEPDMLNPARSQSSAATQIELQIFLPLAEIDPYTYQLTPLLIKEIPAPEPITSGPDSGGVRFNYTIRDEAVWEDGTPVTGHDYAFSVKMTLNPKVDVEQWRGFLTFISDVEIDADNPKTFTVSVGEKYILADLVTCNWNLYPKHIYDPDGLLDPFAIRDLTQPAIADSLAQANPALGQFAEHFMQSKFANETIVGCGPYKLTSWETGQRIILDRVSDWWGDRIEDGPTLLHAYPERLVYEIVPDENTALTMLKDGSVDIVSGISPGAFIALREDATYTDQLDFYTPKLNQYYSLILNNHDPILKEKSVRKALAHLLDYESIIENIAQGMGTRIAGPFHPDVDYYNGQIRPPAFDIEQSRTLLENAGWQDSNGNGVVDKFLSGKRTELELDILTLPSPLGEAISLLLKENAAKAGIAINIVVRESSAFNQDVRARNFDIVTARNDSPITLADPYQSWHSASDAPGGANRAGFRNPTADSLITLIRATEDPVERNKAYKALQVVIAEEQPVLLLYTPLERIIVNSRFEMEPSAPRPGYFEQLFKLAPDSDNALKG